MGGREGEGAGEGGWSREAGRQGEGVGREPSGSRESHEIQEGEGRGSWEGGSEGARERTSEGAREHTSERASEGGREGAR